MEALPINIVFTKYAFVVIVSLQFDKFQYWCELNTINQQVVHSLDICVLGETPVIVGDLLCTLGVLNSAWRLVGLASLAQFEALFPVSWWLESARFE